MSRVLLLATTTGYQTRAFEAAAAHLGIDLVYATDRCHTLDDPWQDQAIPIRFHEPDASVAAIVDSARVRPFDGVLAVGDRPTLIAAQAAQALGLPWHPVGAVTIAGNKQQTRECFRAEGLPVPWFVSGSIDADPRALAGSLQYPCVLKPLALSGSRGVMRADNPHSFVTAFERLRRLLLSLAVRAERNQAHDAILVEGFIPGREYAVEGVFHHGVFDALAIFDKPDPLDGPFFEETIYVAPSMASAAEQSAIVAAVSNAARAIGLKHGPIHAECRIHPEGVFVLEVAARPIGGLCARALRFEAGIRDLGFGIRMASPDGQIPNPQSQITLEELLLRQATGESPSIWEREGDASGVMMIPIPRRGVFRRVDGVDLARQVAGVDDVRITAKVDQMLVPLPEGASYLGFIFASGDSPGSVEGALRAAHAQLGFAIDAEIPVYNRAHG
jgi:biotin carboxylase